jgi:hypothetical protein
MRVFRFALMACAASLLCAAPARDAGLSKAQDAFGRLPLRFEANLGQWIPTVRYAARASEYTLLLTGAGPTIALGGSQRVDISLVGSNPAAEIQPLERLSVRTNYFVGARDRWRTDVPTYSRVQYGQVYNGIDVVYYGGQDHLEYDFTVAPGADPSAIRLRFQGADRVSITPQGDLLVEAAGRRIVQKRPWLYQDAARGAARREVPGRYVMLGNNLIGFSIGRYDPARPLVIDPLLAYSTFLGGTGAEEFDAVKTDSHGYLYMVGSTTATNLTLSPGAWWPTNSSAPGYADEIVAVLDTTAPDPQPLRYLTYLGGSADEFPAAIDVDSQYHLYITGSTDSTDYPVYGNAVQTAPLGTTWNAFVTELDLLGGGLPYSTYLGGTNASYGRGIAVDKNGMMYVIGTTQASDFPVTDSAYAAVLYGPQDMFLTELDPNATGPAYSSYLGGEVSDDGRAIAVGADGLVYFTGTTESTLFPLAGASYLSTLQGGDDIVIGVMDMTQSGVNSLVYATYFGGSDTDMVRRLTFDSSGRLLLAGYTFSVDFPITHDAVQSVAGGNGDAFVSVVDPSRPGAFLVYSTFLGGSHSDVAYDVIQDATGSLLITGYTLSSDFPVTYDAPQPRYGNGAEVFVTKIKPGSPGAGGIEFSTYLGTTGIHVGKGIAVASNGSVYVAGYSTAGLPLVGASAVSYDNTSGAHDAFFLMLTQLAAQPVSSARGHTPPERPAAVKRGSLLR